MEEKEKKPDGAEPAKRGTRGLIAFYIICGAIAIMLIILFFTIFPIGGYGPGTGSGAFFESVAAFQEKFAPIMAFPTYYPEGFDWRGHENEWFEYKNELGLVNFDRNTYDLKKDGDRTRMYANATYNGYGRKYQARKDLDVYESAELAVSLQYPAGEMPDAWLFYTGMRLYIRPLPNNTHAPQIKDNREMLQYKGKEVYFSQWGRNSVWSDEEPFTTMCYDMVFEDRDYRFEFGVWVDRTLSREKREELFAEMKQRCLEEAIKMYDSLEYLEKAGG